jgi:hypothetical protein
MIHETERERAERLKKTTQRRGTLGRNLLSYKNDLNDKAERAWIVLRPFALFRR